jgi:hypothetical protein
MVTRENPSEIETCPYCQFRREIVAIKFPLFKPATALFVCPSCGSACAEPNGFKNKKPARLRLRNISLSVPQAQPNASMSVASDQAAVESIRQQIGRIFQKLSL